MSDRRSSPEAGRSSRGAAQAVYILYLVSLVVGLTGLIGLVVAYVYYGKGEEWVDTHFDYQIRTFWVGLLYLIVGVLTTPLLVGWLVLLFELVWLIVRCVKGLQWLDHGEPVADPKTWLW